MKDYSSIYFDSPLILSLYVCAPSIIIFCLFYFLLFIPAYEKDLQTGKSKIDSLSCNNLGKYIISNSKWAIEEGTPNMHKELYSYAFAKYHVGECKNAS